MALGEEIFDDRRLGHHVVRLPKWESSRSFVPLPLPPDPRRHVESLDFLLVQASLGRTRVAAEVARFPR